MSDLEGTRAAHRRRANLRRRYKVATTGMIAVLLAILGVGFAADAGTTTVTITDSDGVLVYPVASGGAVTNESVRTVTLPNGSTNNDATVTNVATWQTVDLPSWSVAVGAPGTVFNAGSGDLVYIDAVGATSSKAVVSVYVTNLAALAVNYSSWSFQLGIQRSSTAASASWTQDASDFITSDGGQVSFVIDLSTNKHWALTLNGSDPDGTGSYYVIQDGTTGSLSPQFFVRVSQL